MISPDEFLRRCEQVRAEFAVEVTKRQQLTRELAALCALTGARAESVCDQNSQLTGLRVSDPGGNLVISGPVDEVLAELVAVPTSYQNRGPSPSARHRTRGSETAAQPADQVIAVPPTPYQNRGPSPNPRHQTRSSETAAQPADQVVTRQAGPDAIRLDLVGVDESGRARGRWPSRVLSRGHNGGTGGGRPGAWSTGSLGGQGPARVLAGQRFEMSRVRGVPGRGQGRERWWEVSPQPVCIPRAGARTVVLRFLAYPEASPGDDAAPEDSDHLGEPAGRDTWRLLSPAGVSGGAAVPSGLEKRLTATTEALMMAAGEPAEAGRA